MALSAAAMPDLPATMKALRIHRYGGPDAMAVEDAPVPRPGEGEVLVRVAATSINPIDWKIREGLLRAIFDVPLPRILGRDVSGTVAAVGPGVRDLSPGDAVFGVGNPMKDGPHAEYFLTDAALVARKPDAISHPDAAALGVSGLSVLAALVDGAPVEAGQAVLIHGGSGGVGSIAIGYAKSLGASVHTTCSAANADFARSLGADRVIDYKAPDAYDGLPAYDLVLDSVGGATHIASQALLKTGGTLVYLNAAPIPAHTPRADITVLGPPVQGGRERLSRVASLAAEGALRPAVTNRVPLSRIADAYDASQSGTIRGKWVIEPGA